MSNTKNNTLGISVHLHFRIYKDSKAYISNISCSTLIDFQMTFCSALARPKM